MKKVFQKQFIALILSILLLLSIVPVSAVQDALPEGPKILSGSLSTNVVAFEGGTYPGYLKISMHTQLPSQLRIRVQSLNGPAVDFTYAENYEFSTEHSQYWTPIHRKTKQPLTPGKYQLTVFAYDKYGRYDWYYVGSVSVVSDSTKKPLVETGTVNPSTISPRYESHDMLTTFVYKLNRPARVELFVRQLQRIDHGIVHKAYAPNTILGEGMHNISWNGRNTTLPKAPIVANGEYEIILRTREIGYPTGHPYTEHYLGQLTVKDGDFYIPQWRLRELVYDCSWEKKELNLALNETVSAAITLSENLDFGVWVQGIGKPYWFSIPGSHSDDGHYTFTWDGRDSSDWPVEEGQYFLSVRVFENGTFGTIEFKDSLLTVTKNSKPEEPVQPEEPVIISTPIYKNLIKIPIRIIQKRNPSIRLPIYLNNL